LPGRQEVEVKEGKKKVMTSMGNELKEEARERSNQKIEVCVRELG
jgi:hypothetical protein